MREKQVPSHSIRMFFYVRNGQNHGQSDRALYYIWGDSGRKARSEVKRRGQRSNHIDWPWHVSLSSRSEFDRYESIYYCSCQFGLR